MAFVASKKRLQRESEAMEARETSFICPLYTGSAKFCAPLACASSANSVFAVH